MSNCWSSHYLQHKEKASESSAVKTRHSADREPPLPICISININIHQVTRSKKLIQQLYHKGICISYDKVLEVENMIAAEGVVVPACLRKGLFTVGALDNLDHNPSSTTAMNAFHGTVRIRKDNPSESRPLAKLSTEANSITYLEPVVLFQQLL